MPRGHWAPWVPFPRECDVVGQFPTLVDLALARPPLRPGACACAQALRGEVVLQSTRMTADWGRTTIGVARGARASARLSIHTPLVLARAQPEDVIDREYAIFLQMTSLVPSTARLVSSATLASLASPATPLDVPWTPRTEFADAEVDPAATLKP
eukprot:5593194-Prymnesium_polylepis.1